MISLSLVAARDLNGVIGKDGALPWRLKSDMALFRTITLGKPVIMGRKTWDSLPVRPLKGRQNLVLSRDGNFDPVGCLVCETFEEAWRLAREQAGEDGVDEVYVIGGTSVFATALPRAHRLYLTEVQTQAEGDTYFPAFDEGAWTEVRREPHPAADGDDCAYVFRVLERR